MSPWAERTWLRRRRRGSRCVTTSAEPALRITGTAVVTGGRGACPSLAELSRESNKALAFAILASSMGVAVIWTREARAKAHVVRAQDLSGLKIFDASKINLLARGATYRGFPQVDHESAGVVARHFEALWYAGRLMMGAPISKQQCSRQHSVSSNDTDSGNTLQGRSAQLHFVAEIYIYRLTQYSSASTAFSSLNMPQEGDSNARLQVYAVMQGVTRQDRTEVEVYPI